MDQNYSTTDTLHKKGAHLTFEERVIIQTRLRDNQSYRSIAREIGCCVNTVRNEVKRGKVLCYNGKVERYRAADGQSTYEAHRENCGRKCDAIAKGAFLDYVQKKLQEHHWSLDACFGRALVTGEFQRDEMVCTKTLYNYVTLGLLGKIKSIDLPLRVKRKNAKFSSLLELEKLSHTQIYYAHPYCSSDKGTNENHNGLFRRFLPKGKKIQDYPVEHISRVECWANTLPRKILGYKTPEECFEEEMLAALTA